MPDCTSKAARKALDKPPRRRSFKRCSPCSSLTPYSPEYSFLEHEKESRSSNDEGMAKSENLRNYFEEAFWGDGATSVMREEPGEKRVYDLEKPTPRFGE